MITCVGIVSVSDVSVPQDLYCFYILRYMSYTLLMVASDKRSVVAVVGLAHLEGIKKYWKQPIKVWEHSVI